MPGVCACEAAQESEGPVSDQELRDLETIGDRLRWGLFRARRFVRWLQSCRPVEKVRSPHESCGSCGVCYRAVAYWRDSTWLSVVGHEGGLRCLECFAREAIEKGVELGPGDLVWLWVFGGPGKGGDLFGRPPQKRHSQFYDDKPY